MKAGEAGARAETLWGPGAECGPAPHAPGTGLRETLNSRLEDLGLVCPGPTGTAALDRPPAEPPVGTQAAGGTQPTSSSTPRLDEQLERVLWSEWSEPHAEGSTHHLQHCLHAGPTQAAGTTRVLWIPTEAAGCPRQLLTGMGNRPQQPPDYWEEPWVPRCQPVFRKTRTHHGENQEVPCTCKACKAPPSPRAPGSSHGPSRGVRHTEACHLLGNLQGHAWLGPSHPRGRGGPWGSSR